MQQVMIGRRGHRECVLGGRTKIIAPLMSADLRALTEQVARYADYPVDLVEWRVDPLLAAQGQQTIDALEATLRSVGAQIMAASALPVLATLRTGAEGGTVDVDSNDMYEAVVRLLADLADAVDVEIARGSSELVNDCHERGAVVVASSHFFEGTPALAELEDTLLSMDQAGADILKIAAMARSPKDTLTVLAAQVDAAKRHARPVIGIAMGPYGAVTRVSGRALQSAATFASIDEASAPGQLDVMATRRILDMLEPRGESEE
ncbi:type I 3-dehydroquinate dehydratase [Schaalia sp. ZJ405]|uniref:type I 3-dehydroquinate dehydratase n=1 Tax=Schaalia sp. ZJ405 TaxID=2709403 RepID=UPI0013EC0373|nr:type I 3-dehydroquinate dehydratase [Schaalia sp. ZJ405]QPK81761.1 type I 3-dehydroquinate dehydratase [Schaalia sp. ZJ405]